MNTFNKLSGSIGMLCVAVALAAPANAAPTVANGGFETGDFAGWTQFGMSMFDAVVCPGAGTLVYSGSCAATFAAFGAPGGIEQVITGLNVGETYRISFAVQADGGAPSSITAQFGGSTLLTMSNPPSGPYSWYSFDRTAALSSETLRFTFRDDTGFLFLDSVSVSAVPEPGSLAFWAMGAVFAMFVRRRHGSATAGPRLT